MTAEKPGAVLERVTELWGSATIVDSDPVTEVYRNTIYRPLRSHLFLDKDPDRGIYHTGGPIVAAAAYCRFPSRILVGQSEAIPPEPCETAPPGRYVYGGPVIMHYGHFITAALPRLWQIVREGFSPDTKIVCHSHSTPADWFTRDYIASIFGAIGLTADSFVQFPTPTIIPRLIVPRPALQEQTFAHCVFRELCLHVGRSFTSPAVPARTVYLSKTRLSQGVNRLVNEEAIEQAMRCRGIEVAHPETMPFPDQVSLLDGCRTVIGTAGSAMHTTLFSNRPIRLVALAYGPTLNANYALVDGLTGNDASYVYPGDIETIATGAATFNYALRDPERTAAQILDLI